MKIMTRYLLALSATFAFGCGAAPTEEPQADSQEAALTATPLQKQIGDAAAAGTESFSGTCRNLCDTRYNTCIGSAGSDSDVCLCFNARVRCYAGCGIWPLPRLRIC